MNQFIDTVRFLSAIVFALFALPLSVKAQVVINEISTSTTSDWVEIFVLETETEPVDLFNYRIDDTAKTPVKELSGIVDPGTYVSFDVGNRLNNGGDDIKLIHISGESEQTVDSISYGSEGGVCEPEGGQTIGRLPDRTGGFVRLAQATKAAPNSQNQSPCTTPTPEPRPEDEQTTTETSKPTPAKTPSSTSAKTPKPQPSPTVRSATTTSTSKKTTSPKPTTETTETLAQTATSTQEPETLATNGNDSEQPGGRSPAVSFIFIFLGLALMGGASYPLWKDKILRNSDVMDDTMDTHDDSS